VNPGLQQRNWDGVAYDVMRWCREPEAGCSSFQTTTRSSEPPIYAAVNKKKKKDQRSPVSSTDGRGYANLPGDQPAQDSAQQVRTLRLFICTALQPLTRATLTAVKYDGRPTLSTLAADNVGLGLRLRVEVQILCQSAFVFLVLFFLLPSMLGRCWLGVRKSIRLVENGGMRCWCEVQMICIWSS